MNIGVKNLFVLSALIVGAAGCGQSASPPVVAEGVLFSVEWEMKDGDTGGFTRLNNSAGVPGGDGSWNIDAYGKLTDQYLIITRPQQKGLGPRVIPASRLVDVQFGDGGIEKVDENTTGDAHSDN